MAYKRVLDGEYDHAARTSAAKRAWETKRRKAQELRDRREMAEEEARVEGILAKARASDAQRVAHRGIPEAVQNPATAQAIGAVAKNAATSLTDAQRADLLALFQTLKASHQARAEFLLRDDPAHGFTVPSHDRKILGPMPAFHQELYTLQDDLSLRFAAADAPRGFGKSVNCSVSLPLGDALFMDATDILLVSATEDLSFEWLGEIRRHFESNERIRRYWGNLASDKWTQSEIQLTTGVVIRAKGMGAQIRGFHPQLIVVDDLESEETGGMYSTPEQREKLREWFFRVLVNALSVDGRMFVIGSILGPHALLKDLVQHPRPGWKTRHYAAYVDGVEEPGHELWPEQRPHTWLQARKATIGTWAFAAEYMGRPVPATERKFNPDLFKFVPALPADATTHYMTIDPAVSEKPNADFKAALSGATSPKNILYLTDYVNQRGSTRDYIQAILNTYRVWRHRRIGVEVVAFQQLFKDELNRIAVEQGLYPPFEPLKTDTRISKEYRIEALEPRFRAGGIIFVGTPDYWKPLLQQLEDYHGKGTLTHDDLLDCLARMLDIIEPTFTTETTPEPDSDIVVLGQWGGPTLGPEPEDATTGTRGTTGYGEDAPVMANAAPRDGGLY